ncbi:MAG: hypothetical protein GY696_08775, partial [Gammaproteobacteria bacterium]|nr:hypothetical protein [Gammaproteobacteria bacterium]
VELKKAYWHIVLDEESRHFTAFLTPSHGLLQFKRLRIGMMDSAACFQRAIEQSLSGLEGMVSFIDDILIWGDTKEQHDERVRATFGRLERDGFHVTEPKLLLERQQIPMLGQLLTVTENGTEIIPDPKRHQDFFKIPPPSNLKKLQQFLGAANYFSAYIPHFSSIAEQLFRLKRKKCKFQWDDSCTKAFETIKDAIASPKVLVPFDPQCPAHLTTDASLVGPVLSIKREGKLCLVAFASKLMTETERRYSTPEHEALACVGQCRNSTNSYSDDLLLSTPTINLSVH